MERLHKVLAHAGLGSRRDCEDLIREGRVTVDGAPVTELGAVVDPRTQTIKVDGVVVRRKPPVYFLLYKPKGAICTTAENAREPRAIDFAPRGSGPLHTVGRLDKDSEGLIILTNDGALTEKLTHPRNEVPKLYRVLVKGRVAGEAIARMKAGVWLAEGKARASAVRVLSSRPGTTLLEVELREGMNREIRRMLAKLGFPVKKLVRAAIGPLRIADLKPGAVRPIPRTEVEELLRWAEAPRPAKQPPPRGAKPGGPTKEKGRAGRESKKAGASTAPPERAPGGERPKPAAPRLPDPPPEPPRPRPRYEPDAEGVIVVRRPGVRFAEAEEEEE
jgi:23S rRNA pseudouridine2605 synthase